MSNNENSSASGVLLSFVVGGLAGAALAILFAPRAGRETRELIADRVKDGLDKGRHLKDEVVTRSQRLRDDAVDFVEERKERLGSAIEAGQQAYREARDRS
ncbi:MAG: YtxH domain-containing protein [Vicinamibacteria bacterium]|nr:YtxH domain-containing protein [Vicinamibacteria bacterium]MBP9945996.1 YtxH domain-containing protein [Vicinamibacteria bacterium]